MAAIGRIPQVSLPPSVLSQNRFTLVMPGQKEQDWPIGPSGKTIDELFCHITAQLACFHGTVTLSSPLSDQGRHILEIITTRTDAKKFDVKRSPFKKSTLTISSQLVETLQDQKNTIRTYANGVKEIQSSDETTRVFPDGRKECGSFDSSGMLTSGYSIASNGTVTWVNPKPIVQKKKTITPPFLACSSLKGI